MTIISKLIKRRSAGLTPASFFLIAIMMSCSSSPGKLYSTEMPENNNRFDKNTLRFLPSGYSLKPVDEIAFKLNAGVLTLYSTEFKQGSAVLVEIICDQRSKDQISGPVFRFRGKKVPLNENHAGYFGVFAIPPDVSKGDSGFTLDYRINRSRHTLSDKITIADGAFPVSMRPLDLGKHSDAATREDPQVIKRIQRERQQKNKAFETRSDNMLGPVLSHPRDMHHITSPFWSQRRYQRFRIVDGEKKHYPDTVRIHRGLDLRGAEGSDVYSMAGGRVVLADKLFFEGNMVIIDHGNRVFSYYMHMSKINVETGDLVKAGQTIGFVGSTGMSTAPHLHVSVVIDGVQVDPLSFLALPFRD